MPYCKQKKYNLLFFVERQKEMKKQLCLSDNKAMLIVKIIGCDINYIIVLVEIIKKEVP